MAELDEKLVQINKKTGIPPFSAIPTVEEFNEQHENYYVLKTLCFIVALLPRKDNNPHSIDWDYLKEIEQGNKQKPQYHPSFATLTNYQELGNRLLQRTNTDLTSLGQEFANLTNTERLNNWQNKYLDKIFIGNAYNIVREGLNEQMNVPGHIVFEFEEIDNQATNSQLASPETYILLEHRWRDNK